MSRVSIARAAAALLLVAFVPGSEADVAVQSVAIDKASIGGIVVNAGTDGAEAGVWVIAETDGLPTRFRRIVVTDDQGRFVVPDLPDARYSLWVRGYGLADAARVRASRGDRLTMRVSSASSALEAARVYPASYWLSLYAPPPPSELPLSFASQAHWIADLKLGCMRCHQFGGPVFHGRTTPGAWEEAWHLRPTEARTADTLGRDVLNRTLAEWAGRIHAGQVPDPPPRPSGVERNIVVTQWEWGRDDSYIHDEISTDKRNPSLYPYGKIWGVDFGQDLLWALDPRTHRVTSHKVPTGNVLNRAQPPPEGAVVYNNPANPHVPTMDDAGRVWIAMQTRRERPEDSPRWTREVIVNVQEPSRGASTDLPAWAEGTHHRQLGYFDTTREAFVLIDTAFGTNHLQFDAQGRLWTSGDSVGVGMFDPKAFDWRRPQETGPRAQKVFVSVDPASGRSVGGGGYGIAVNPVDGAVWRTNTYIGQTGAPDNTSFAGQNKIVKFDPARATFADYPLPPPARSPIGIDAATDGSVWFGTASGHLGRFDPRSERFTYWQTPGPRPSGASSDIGSADFHYSIFVDQFNASGLGKDTVILTGANSDALVAFDPTNERFTVARVPYPLTMYHRGIDGRIDDQRAGWKGRGLWLNYGNDPVKFVEGGIGALVHIQLRPNPLAY